MFHKTRNVLRERIGLGLPFERIQVLGRQLNLRAGTLRKEPDYDDAWFLLCLQHAKVVFDVGANVGQGAVFECLLDNITDVVLVEANPKALAIASENLITNFLGEKVRFVCAYAGSENETSVRFWTVGSGAAGSSYPGHA